MVYLVNYGQIASLKHDIVNCVAVFFATVGDIRRELLQVWRVSLEGIHLAALWAPKRHFLLQGRQRLQAVLQTHPAPERPEARPKLRSHPTTLLRLEYETVRMSLLRSIKCLTSQSNAAPFWNFAAHIFFQDFQHIICSLKNSINTKALILLN